MVRVRIKKLVFSGTVMTMGFPCELSLKNSFSVVSVYDNEFDIKMGETQIKYYKDHPDRKIHVRIVLDKEKFNYLYLTSMSSKKLPIEFNTPTFSLDKFEGTSQIEPLILQNCSFMVNDEISDS
jgi:DNA-dependent RNA polymerase auxiliary subunit epsilon